MSPAHLLAALALVPLIGRGPAWAEPAQPLPCNALCAAWMGLAPPAPPPGADAAAPQAAPPAPEPPPSPAPARLDPADEAEPLPLHGSPRLLQPSRTAAKRRLRTRLASPIVPRRHATPDATALAALPSPDRRSLGPATPSFHEESSFNATSAQLSDAERTLLQDELQQLQPR